MWDTLGSDSEAGFCYLPSHSSRPRSASLAGGAAVGIGAWWCAIWRGKNPPFSRWVPLSPGEPDRDHGEEVFA